MDKIDDIKKQLRGEVEDKDGVKKLVYFDVKDGAEDGVPYYKTYLDQTTASMGALFKKAEWGELTPWEKLCCYKISGSAGVGVDCDAALRSTVIYQLVFGYGDAKEDAMEIVPYKGCYRLEGDGLILRGDTMNSYATTVHEYFHRVFGADQDLLKKLKSEHIIEKQEKGRLYTDSQYIEMISTDKNDGRHWERAILHRYDDFFAKRCFPAADEFFRLYHTVGNFLPAPPAFQDRGSMQLPSHDYWDLALMCIYNYFCKVNDPKYKKYTLEWLIKKEEAVSSCRAWLDSFGSGQGGWDCFVERNFLQDFVNRDGEPYGPPKELWKGHFANGTMPRKAADFEQFFTNTSAWIAERGERIALAVKEALAAEKSAAAREAHP